MFSSLKRYLASLSSGPVARKGTPARRHVERLESRWAMAGNVTAAMNAAGDLIISGDALANPIGIEGTGNPGELTVQAFSDDLLQPTTLNGGTVPITFTGVTGSVVAFMGAGNDSISFVRARVEGAVVLDGGTGTDHFFLGQGTFNGVPPLSIGRELILRGGIGFNRVFQEYVEVGTSEIIDFGSEEGRVHFVDTGTGFVSNIAMDLVIRTGDSNDIIEVNRVNVGRYTLVDTGFNHDTITVDRSQFGNSTALLSGDGNDLISINRTTFNAMYVDTGLGHDFFGMIRSTMTGHFFLTTQAGSDTVSFSNNTMATLYVDTGIDNDLVAMEATTLDELTVQLSDGSDTLTTRINTVDTTTILDGGAGDDLWEELGNTMAGLQFRNFERYRFS